MIHIVRKIFPGKISAQCSSVLIINTSSDNGQWINPSLSARSLRPGGPGSVRTYASNCTYPIGFDNVSWNSTNRYFVYITITLGLYAGMSKGCVCAQAQTAWSSSVNQRVERSSSILSTTTQNGGEVNFHVFSTTPKMFLFRCVWISNTAFPK